MSQEQTIIRRPSYLSNLNPQEDLVALLKDLEDLADEPYAFMGRAWGLNLEEFHMLTNKIRASLPDEVRRASRVANDSDKIVSAAKEDAEAITEQATREANRIIEEARQMAAKLVDTADVTRLAKAQAQELISRAEAASRETRRGADEYAREVLAAIECHLAKVMGTLQKGREKLEIRISAQQEDQPIIPAGRGNRR